MELRKLFLILFLTFLTNPLYSQETDLDEYHVFMFDLIEELNFREYENFFNAIDFQALAEGSVKGLDIPEVDKLAFMEGFKDGMKRDFGKSYSAMFDASDYIEYINYSEELDDYFILVRVSGDFGLNYINFKINKNEVGELRITDFYPFISGEFVTETMNKTAKIVFSESSFFDRILSGLDDKERELTLSLPKIAKIRNLSDNELFDEAREEYEKLPLSVQNNKLFILIMLPIAQQLEETFYLSLIDSYEEFYPNDPGFPLMILDSYLLRGKIAEAQEQVNILDEAIGGDNFLNVLRGNIAIINTDTVSARAFYSLAIENDFYFEDAYWELISLEIASKNFEEAVKYLKKTSKLFGYTFSEENFMEEEYLEFSNSQAFKEWISTQ